MPRLPKVKPGDLVAVQWEDAWADDEAVVELGEDNPGRPYLIWVTGYVTKADKAGFFVAREKLADGRFRSVQYIPRAYVKQVRILEDGTPLVITGETVQ